MEYRIHFKLYETFQLAVEKVVTSRIQIQVKRFQIKPCAITTTTNIQSEF